MKCHNICIKGASEGGEEVQGIEYLFKKVMIKNFPNMMRESQTSPGNTESPNQNEPKEAHLQTHHN